MPLPYLKCDGESEYECESLKKHMEIDNLWAGIAFSSHFLTKLAQTILDCFVSYILVGEYSSVNSNVCKKNEEKHSKNCINWSKHEEKPS